MNQDVYLKSAQLEIVKKADYFMDRALLGYFAFGLLLSPFYETWTIAFSVGLPALGLYYLAKFSFKNSSVYQYVGSVVLGIFMAQFIYQMHGLFEMHFFAFVSALVIMAYQNWKLQVPNLLFIVVHHSLFAYLQYSGNPEVYFTQLEYMDVQTFLFHAGLAAVIIALAAYWSYQSSLQSKRNLLNAFKLQTQVDNLNKNIAFAEKISEGDYETTYEATEEDEMGNSLLRMRESLKVAKQREDEENYINVGVAKISDILRSHMENVSKLSEAILPQLINYLKANQGGVFILNDENENEKFFELKAAFAYERKKFLNKKIAINEGLVGACFLEGEPIYMTEIPEGYLSIRSGLGDAPPRNLMLLPLKSNEEIVGVLEIASFQVFSDSQKAFLDRVAENIAATVISTKNNEKTARLYEESQTQSEALRAQEEEMRQNMEELEATQEEMRRQNYLNERYANAVDNSSIIIEFDSNGTIIHVNQKFVDTTGYSYDEIVGQKHTYYVPQSAVSSGAFDTLWKDLSKGKSFVRDVERVKKNKQSLWLRANYMPMFDQDGTLEKISCICFDITEQKQQEKKIEENKEQLNSIIKNTPGFIYRCKNDENWTMLFASEKAAQITGYSANEFTNGNIHLGDIIIAEDQEMVAKQVNEGLASNKHFDVKYRIKTKTGEIRWVWDSGTYSTVKQDGLEVIEGIIQDITEQKQLQEKLNQQVRELNEAEQQMKDNMEELQAAQEEMLLAQNKSKEKEERLNAILEYSADTIFAIDKNYRIILANQRLKEKYAQQGITLKEGIKVNTVIPEEVWETWKEKYDTALGGEKLVYTEKRKDESGKEMQVEVSCLPIEGDKKQVVGALVLTKDITKYVTMKG